MRLSVRRVAGAVAAVLAVSGTVLLSGCKPEGKFTADEEKQFKEGPPVEMPAEARKAMEEMRKGGRGGETPPRPAGQPGPGAPVGPR